MSNSANLIPREQLDEIASLLRLLSNPTRLRIIDFLYHSKEPQMATRVAEAVDEVSQAVASRHLAELREGGIIVGERQGSKVLYSLCSEKAVAMLLQIRKISDGAKSGQGHG